MKAYRRSQVELHSVSTSNRGEGTASRIGRFTPGWKPPVPNKYVEGYTAWLNTKKPYISGEHTWPLTLSWVTLIAIAALTF
jgi:hypothetical protein